MGPRWRKVFRDLSNNRIRTILVVLSVAVGVFATGMVTSAQAIFSRELTRSYLAAHPSTAILYTTPFDETLLSSVRGMRGVEQVEARSNILVRVQVGPNTWQTLQLFAIPNFHNIQVDRVSPVSGAWPPPKHGIVIERNARELLPAGVGSTVRVETPDGKQRDLAISGVAHDLILYPANLLGRAYGYMTYDTLEWLTNSRDYTELHIVLDPTIRSRDAIQEAIDQIRKKVELGGITVGRVNIPPYLDKSPVDDIIQAMVWVLGVLGILSLLLSVFLIVNIISALLIQQTSQIGVMKAIGGRPTQIIAMYSTMIVIMSVLAVVIGVPTGIIGARLATSYIARFINYDITSFEVPLPVFLLQIAVGLLLPFLSSLYPILAGTGVTVREALNPPGVGNDRFGGATIDRLIAHIHFLPRPLLLSLRNTVRRKGRLVLTLLTLTTGGTIFISTLSVRSSAFATLSQTAKYWNYDAEITFQQPYRRERIKAEALGTPKIVGIENWLRTTVRRVRDDGHESNSMRMIAPTAGTTLIQPEVLQGRWLLPTDQNAIVINTDVLKEEPDISVGDEVTLLINDRKSSWRVVGIITGQLNGSSIYSNYEYFAQAADLVGRANFTVVVTERHDQESRSEIARALEQRLKDAHLQLSSIQNTSSLNSGLRSQFDILMIFLFLMALLLGIVGGLGLTGTMSINVLERIREVGIMRAIGASNQSIFQIVIGEGLCIGGISWFLGTILAFPISQQMSYTVGIIFLQTPLYYRYSLIGIGLCLLVIVILALLASSLPAWRAMCVQVREVLAYDG